jgi:hypothetical protein
LLSLAATPLAAAPPALHAKAQPPSAAAAIPRWNPKAPENAQLLPAFSVNNIAPVINAVGARAQRSGSDPAKPALLVTFPNGRRALLSLSACDPQGNICKALGIQSFWVKSATVAPEKTAEAVQRFNQQFAFAKAFVTPDGRTSLQRYLTADYGFIRGDLAVNLLNFAELAQTFAVDFLEPLEKAAKPPAKAS